MCHCMVVSESEIAACIRAGATTVDEVGLACEAGSGCGSCRGGIEVMIAEHKKRVASRGDAAAVLAQLGLFGDASDR